MNGEVAQSEATLPCRVRGPKGAIFEFRACVDTGFHGWLTLPSEIIGALNLTFREMAHYVLADGSMISRGLFTADVEWMGQWRPVFVVEIESAPLLGMALLSRCRLTIDVVDGGRVEIVPLQA